jgi:hypothetical protein
MRQIRLERGIQRPTPEQQAAFIDHVCYAHSWYKHISPDTGAEFVVFLSTEGEQFARGVSHDAYRRACGFLAYAWRIDTDLFRIDGGDDIDIAPELRRLGGVTLFPYCSNDVAAIECFLTLYGCDEPQPASLRALLDADSEANQTSIYERLRRGEVHKLADAIARVLEAS